MRKKNENTKTPFALEDDDVVEILLGGLLDIDVYTEFYNFYLFCSCI
jgi:hypothetical protein